MNDVTAIAKPNNLQAHYTAPGETLSVCCVSPEADDHLEYIVQVVSIFTGSLNFSLSVFSQHPSLDLIREYIPENVRFLPGDINQVGAGIVITYGPGALHFIKAKIPVVILGPYGFGGLITTSNFNWFVENGFMGRPGGYLREEIPASIVLDELMECKQKHDILFAPEQLNALNQLAAPLSHAI